MLNVDFDDDDYTTPSTTPFGRSANTPFGNHPQAFGHSTTPFSASAASHAAPFGAGFSSTPTGPFSASSISHSTPFGGGGGWGADSPSGTSTPIAERSAGYFGGGGFGQQHARGESINSVDSANSYENNTTNRTYEKSSTSYDREKERSFTAPSPSIPSSSGKSAKHANGSSMSASRKPSFASIRNAFKNAASSSSFSAGSSKERERFYAERGGFGTRDVDTPPLPSLDFQLKSPFGRSTSSLGSPLTSRNAQQQQMQGFGVAMGTPGSPGGSNSANIFGGAGIEREKGGFAGASGNPFSPGAGADKGGGPFAFGAVGVRRKHSYAKSYHSQSGSVEVAPPVPKVPPGAGVNAFASPFISTPPNGERTETPDLSEDAVDPNPKTPSDYALHAVFMRFASAAEAKVDRFLRIRLVSYF